MAEELKKQFGLDIEKRKIAMADIKAYGSYEGGDQIQPWDHGQAYGYSQRIMRGVQRKGTGYAGQRFGK